MGNKKLCFKNVIKGYKLYNDSTEELALIEKYAVEVTSKLYDEEIYGMAYPDYLLELLMILVDLKADQDTLISAILKDADLKNYPELKPDIIKIIKMVSKLNDLKISTDNDALISYYKKIIVGLAEDVRVIVIALADTLIKLKHLDYLSLEEQKEEAKIALNIYSPIAEHLGIYRLKSEMEDKAFKYLNPDVYFSIAEELNATKKERDLSVHLMTKEISELLEKHSIHDFEIFGRSKSIYSIYKKLNQGKTFKQIYDFLAMRILVKDINTCYQALGLIHAKYRPMSGRFKDYIARPKANGYQSLHTTVFGSDNNLYEVQIRTREMDDIAENGAASHWSYKEKKNLNETGKNLTESRLEFFKVLIDMNKENVSNEEIINTFNETISDNFIYTYTPKGDIIDLPIGSTPVDFAYRVHTEVGHKTTGAIVNNTIVPLDYELKNDDIVKIITDKNSKGPSREWIQFVKSTQTKSKIKAFFNKGSRENYIIRGKSLLEKELRKNKYSLKRFLSKENLEKLIKECNISNEEELFLNIGKNVLSAKHVVNFILGIPEDNKEKVSKTKTYNKSNNISSILVAGEENIKVTIASCCHPVPGDDIVGLVTKHRGITAHRAPCSNVNKASDRMVDAKWSKNIREKFISKLIIHAEREEILSNLMKSAIFQNIVIHSLKNNRTDDGVVYTLEIYISNKEEIEKLIKSLDNSKGIMSAKRSIE